MLDLVAEHQLQAGDVTRIEVEISRTASGILRNSAPRTGLDAKFSEQFAMASAVPAGSFRGKAQPATGPYMTRAFVPNRSWVLARNPQFHEWSSEAQPAGFPDRYVTGVAVDPSALALDDPDGRPDSL